LILLLDGREGLDAFRKEGVGICRTCVSSGLGKLRRAGQAQAFELLKQFTPGLGAFWVANRRQGFAEISSRDSLWTGPFSERGSLADLSAQSSRKPWCRPPPRV
jgi:hypothetical protein